MPHIKRRLEEFLSSTKLGKGEFAKRATISGPYLSQLLAGDNESPGVEQLEGLARAMGISLAELVSDSKELAKLKGHSVSDCLGVVADVIELLEGDVPHAALSFLRGKKR